MEKILPFVSVIMPCLNEEKFISVCLDSVIACDYPKERMEILVVDGMSRDRTREIAEKYMRENSFLRLLDNPKKTTPAAMNLGINNSKGEIIIKMDAHSRYEKDYISKCVKHLQESGAKNVGGILKTVPAKDTLFAKAIAVCLSSRFGAGSSYFRTGTDKPRWVDTVAFGCYKKDTLVDLGLFDERMEKIEDFELNSRLRKKYGPESILLAPDIRAFYYPSSDNIFSFLKHNFTDGFWTTYSAKLGFKFFSLRHMIPLVFSASLILGFILALFSFWFRALFDIVFLSYFFVNFLVSISISLREKLNLFPFLSVSFFTRHFFYGLGSIWGIIKMKK